MARPPQAKDAFPVRGPRAGRLPEDDWELDTEYLRAAAARLQELERERMRRAARAIREAGDGA